MAQCQCNSNRIMSNGSCNAYSEGMENRPEMVDPDERICGSYDNISGGSPTNYIEYWKCGSYVFNGYDTFGYLNSISSTDAIIDNRTLSSFCNSHASTTYDPGGQDEALSAAVREGWTYIVGNAEDLSIAHSSGYRNKNNNRNLSQWILNANLSVQTKNFISANWINALSTSLSNEICDRLKNHLYSNKTDDVNTLINGLAPNNIVDGNIVDKLRQAMNLLSSGVMSDTSANLQPKKSVIPNSKNIQTLSTIIANTEVRKFINDCNTAYKDCICYSDCGGYAVCFCYGNCNYY